jgi:hypothetical protein
MKPLSGLKNYFCQVLLYFSFQDWITDGVGTRTWAELNDE